MYYNTVNLRYVISIFIFNQCQQGSVILLENLRFHVEEEGKGVDSEGKKVMAVFFLSSLLLLVQIFCV